MNEHEGGWPEDDATRELVSVDEVCRRFARMLVEGQPPEIDGFLRLVPDSLRDELRRRLQALSALLSRGTGTALLKQDETIRHVGGERATGNDATIRHSLGSVSGSDPAQETIRRMADRTAREERADPETGSEVSDEESAVAIVAGYRIEKVLGRGGMGVVYQAIQLSLNRRVALKMVLDPRAATEEALRRFELEAKAVAELNDPRFVQIYEYGIHDGKPYMALELVEGGSLEDFRQSEPQPERLAARITQSLAGAMHVAHAAGLVHRDLKPQNVLLTEDRSAKITDFGLVKRLDHDDSQMTQHGRVMGTASYMAPEQSRGETDIGPPADIHALGGILYCLLTGRPPFLGSNVFDTIQQVRTEEPVPPSRLRPKLSKDLETICLKCLQKDPAKRYESAEALADDLERFLSGRPILARPIGLPERGWRWTKRNPLAATVAALVLAIAVGASAASWHLTALNHRLVVEQRNTEAARRKEAEQRRRAVAARQAKSRQYNEVLMAYHTVLDRVERRLRNDPSQVKLRKEIVELAMNSLGRVRDESEAGVLADRDQAVGHQRLGGIYQVVGQLEEAKHQYELASKILTAILEKHPDDPQHIRNVAAIAMRRASVLDRLGDRPQARSLYEEALALRKRWDEIRTRQNHANHLDAKRAVAQTYVALGSIDLELGDPQRALTQFEAAREWYRKLPKKILLRPVVFRELTGLEHWLGETYSRLGDLEQAEKMLTRAVQKRVLLMKNDDTDSAKLAYCRSRMILGDFYFIHADNLFKAWRQYCPVWELSTELFEGNSFSRDVKWNLANIAYRLGTPLLEAQRRGIDLEPALDPMDSQVYFKRACDLREELAAIDEDDMQARIEWALALARCGRVEEAEKQAHVLLDRGKNDPRLLFQAACTLALAGLGDDEPSLRRRDRAFDVLQDLLESDWRDALAIERDPDLAPLRGDPRFDKLVAAFSQQAKKR